MGSCFSYAPVVIFIILLIFIILIAKGVQKKNVNYIEDAQKSTRESLELARRSMALAEESNRILKEMLEVLRSKDNK